MKRGIFVDVRVTAEILHLLAVLKFFSKKE